MSGSPPLMNEPESRTSTGEIKDQGTTPPVDQPTSTTTPTEPEKKPETPPEPEKKPEDAKTGAPEKYEDFKLPEGVTLAGDQLEKATAIFKELGLDQAAAQKLVDFHAEQVKAVAAAPDNAWDAMTAEWKSKLEADPDIGPHQTQIKKDIGQALATLPKDLVSDFQHVMNLTGVGDHPAFVKVMKAFAERVIEGKPVTPKGPAEVKAPDSKPASAASALYPNLPA